MDCYDFILKTITQENNITSVACSLPEGIESLSLPSILQQQPKTNTQKQNKSYKIIVPHYDVTYKMKCFMAQ